MVFEQGVEMDIVPPNTFSLMNLNGFLASSLHNVLLDSTILAIKAVVLSLTMIGEVSSWNAARHDECIANGGFPIPELYVGRKPEPERKDASETEGDNEDDDDDEDDAINKEVEDGEDDDDVSGDDGEDEDDDDDPDEVPNVNGDGGSDDEDDEGDDDDDDEENEDDEDDDEEEEEEDEEVPQPPAKKRK